LAFKGLLVAAVCLAGTSLAGPFVVVEAREAFSLRLVDGGYSPFTSMLALPGQDLALVGPTDVGLPLGTTDYALVQLGGAQAGAVVGAIHAPPGAAQSFPEQIVRAGGSGSGSSYWTLHASSLAGALGYIASNQMTLIQVLDRSFADGTALSADPQGYLRSIGLDPQGNVTSFAFVDRDGGVGTQALGIIRIQAGLTPPSGAFSPPGTDDVFAYSGTLPATALYGRFSQPDAGLDPLGPVPDSPVAFTSRVYTYLVGLNSGTGVFLVTELSATAATPRGTFSVVVDGGCSSLDCASPTLTLQALREGFPGYPNGALLLTHWGRAGEAQQAVLVPWEGLVGALGLQTDATPAPAAALVPGPGGSAGPVNPRGPGVGSSSTSGCSASASTAAPLAALAVVLLAAWRPRRPGA
jgi:MYXO-CTERM domain-containing protein